MNNTVGLFYNLGGTKKLYPDNEEAWKVVVGLPSGDYSSDMLTIKRTNWRSVCFAYSFKLAKGVYVGLYVVSNRTMLSYIPLIFRHLENCIHRMLVEGLLSVKYENGTLSGGTLNIKGNEQTFESIFNNLYRSFYALSTYSVYTMPQPEYGYDSKEYEFVYASVKKDELCRLIGSGKYVVILGSGTDFLNKWGMEKAVKPKNNNVEYKETVKKKEPVMETVVTHDVEENMQGNASGNVNVCSAFYWFYGMVGTLYYNQYPCDYTEDMFKYIGAFCEPGCSLVIRRNGDMVYYVYLHKSESGLYVGFGTAVNGIMFDGIDSICSILEKALRTLAAKNIVDAKILGGLFLDTKVVINYEGYVLAKDEIGEMVRRRFGNLSYRVLPALSYGVEIDKKMDLPLAELNGRKGKLEKIMRGNCYIVIKQNPSAQQTNTPNGAKLPDIPAGKEKSGYSDIVVSYVCFVLVMIAVIMILIGCQ